MSYLECSSHCSWIIFLCSQSFSILIEYITRMVKRRIGIALGTTTHGCKRIWSRICLAQHIPARHLSTPLSAVTLAQQGAIIAFDLENVTSMAMKGVRDVAGGGRLANHESGTAKTSTRLANFSREHKAFCNFSEKYIIPGPNFRSENNYRSKF